jgi:hypothetical protein
MTSSYRRTVRVPQAPPPDPDPSTPGTAGKVTHDLACQETSRTRAFMYVIDDNARTRRTVTLVIAITGAGAVLLSLLALLPVALGPVSTAVGSGIGSVGSALLAALVRRSPRWLLRGTRARVHPLRRSQPSGPPLLHQGRCQPTANHSPQRRGGRRPHPVHRGTHPRPY